MSEPNDRTERQSLIDEAGRQWLEQSRLKALEDDRAGRSIPAERAFSKFRATLEEKLREKHGVEG